MIRNNLPGEALDSRLGRPLVRVALTSTISRLPNRMLEALRETYARSTPGTLREQVFGAALEVVRHIGIPATVESFQVDSRPPLLLTAGDSLVLQRLYWFGARGWEPALARWWRECVEHASSVAELGANVGYYTALAGAARRDLHYIAVEPHPVSVAILKRNLLLNGVEASQIVEAAAVHDERQLVELLVPQVDHFAAPAGAFVGDASELEQRHTVTLTVTAISFREVVEDADLVKLDVEGQEYQLLHSAQEILMRNRAVLVIELLDDAQLLRAFVRDVCEQHSYVAVQPTMDSLRVIPVASLGTTRVVDRMGTRDILVLPAEHPLAARAVS